MALIHWWMPPLFALATLVTIAVAAARARSRRRRLLEDAASIRAAHVDRLAQSPRFRSLVARHRRGIAAGMLASILMIGCCSVLAARLVRERVERPDLHSRDVVLCLDVSGSMTETDAEVAGTFAELAEDFDGERIALTLFDSSAAPVFPLTDDADFVADRLSELEDAFADGTGEAATDIYAGTALGEGSSLIGDGLASCVLAFDRPDERRPRAIVLATDNYVSGAQIVTLDEAAALAREREVRVYALNPSDNGGADAAEGDEAVELRDAARATGGRAFPVDDPSAARDIARRVDKSEAARLRGAPRLVRTDVPEPLVVALAAVVALLVVAGWRSRS